MKALEKITPKLANKQKKKNHLKSLFLGEKGVKVIKLAWGLLADAQNRGKK